MLENGILSFVDLRELSLVGGLSKSLNKLSQNVLENERVINEWLFNHTALRTMFCRKYIEAPKLRIGVYLRSEYKRKVFTERNEISAVLVGADLVFYRLCRLVGINEMEIDGQLDFVEHRPSRSSPDDA